MKLGRLTVFVIAFLPVVSAASPYETTTLSESQGWLVEKGKDLADGAQICRMSTRTAGGRSFEIIHHQGGAAYVTIADENWQLASRIVNVSLVVNRTEWQFLAVAEGSQIELQLAPSQVFAFKSDLVWGENLSLQNAAGERISGFNVGNAKNATWAFATCLPSEPTVRPADPDPFD